MRYSLDKVAALCGLICLSPILLVAGIAVATTSRGGVFFRQIRIGKNGEPFRIHKFRTMYAKPITVNVSTSNDPRVTPVGRILRKTKIDELPQLIDVLLGKMALVGPRPEVPEYVELWPADLRPKILSVLPGITDPASIKYRNEAEELAAADDPERYYVEELLPKKAVLYAQYVTERSLLGDLKLIAKTIAAVIKS